jgi:hypothetical protein
MKKAMQKQTIRLAGLLLLALAAWPGAMPQAQSQTKANPYPTMAPLDQYLIADKTAEIALARSAAPPAVSDGAEVLVLTPDGYKTAAKGGNGFTCLVVRSWATETDSPDFWNTKLRAPHCLNAAATRSYLPIYLLRTKLALAASSRADIGQAVKSAFDKKEFPELEPGAMCYMMSKQQYLNDRGKSWRPHLMWYVAGDVAPKWGANLEGSPVLAANVPQDRMTIFMVPVANWSDGTLGPQ